MRAPALLLIDVPCRDTSKLNFTPAQRHVYQAYTVDSDATSITDL